MGKGTNFSFPSPPFFTVGFTVDPKNCAKWIKNTLRDAITILAKGL